MSRARDRGATARGTMSVRRLEKGVVFAADAPRVGFTKSVSGSYGHSVRAFGGVASTIDKPVMKKTVSVAESHPTFPRAVVALCSTRGTTAAHSVPRTDDHARVRAHRPRRVRSTQGQDPRGASAALRPPLAASASAEPRILSSTGGAHSPRVISTVADTPHRLHRTRRDERGRLRPGRWPRRAPRRARRAGEGAAGRASRPRPGLARLRAALRRVPRQDQEGRGGRDQGRPRREDAGAVPGARGCDQRHGARHARFVG